jgi:hypothetical protein
MKAHQKNVEQKEHFYWLLKLHAQLKKDSLRWAGHRNIGLERVVMELLRLPPQ